MPADDPRAYTAITENDRLYQGEILANVVERVVRWIRRTEEGDDDFGIDEIVHPYAVIVTQDCDLEQDARARADEHAGKGGLVHSLLLVVASEFENAKDRFAGSDIRKRARQNKDDRYQFLSPVPAGDDVSGAGIPALVLDFKRLFAYPTPELLGAIERGETRRRTRLFTPYAEHLSDRFGHFVQRVGLPRDHHDFEM